MAFSADELRVLRRALAIALHPMPLSDEDVQDCLRLAGSVDEAVGEAGRLRAFLLADLARYRNALPGSATGYLELLQDALAAGRLRPPPGRSGRPAGLRGGPLAAALLERCQVLAERSVRARLAGRSAGAAAPGPRSRLLALPGGRAAPGSRTGPGPRPHRTSRRSRASAPCPSPPRSSRRGGPHRPRPRSGRPADPPCFPDAAPSTGRSPRRAVSGSLLWTAWTTYPRSCPRGDGRLLRHRDRDHREEPGWSEQDQGGRRGRRGDRPRGIRKADRSSGECLTAGAEPLAPRLPGGRPERTTRESRALFAAQRAEHSGHLALK